MWALYTRCLSSWGVASQVSSLPGIRTTYLAMAVPLGGGLESVTGMTSLRHRNRQTAASRARGWGSTSRRRHRSGEEAQEATYDGTRAGDADGTVALGVAQGSASPQHLAEVGEVGAEHRVGGLRPAATHHQASVADPGHQLVVADLQGHHRIEAVGPLRVEHGRQCHGERVDGHLA